MLTLSDRSLEGVFDELRSDQLVDGVAIQNVRKIRSNQGLINNDSDDEHFAASTLPGVTGGQSNNGSRNTRPDIRTNSVSFSSTGKEWAAATTQGLQARDICFEFFDLMYLIDI